MEDSAGVGQVHITGVEEFFRCSWLKRGLLLLIEVTGSQWNFPLPIHVGDPEQRLYELFGKPGWQYEYDGIRQIDYDLTGRLSVYIREGKVSRIIWGVG